MRKRDKQRQSTCGWESVAKGELQSPYPSVLEGRTRLATHQLTVITGDMGEPKRSSCVLQIRFVGPRPQVTGGKDFPTEEKRRRGTKNTGKSDPQVFVLESRTRNAGQRIVLRVIVWEKGPFDSRSWEKCASGENEMISRHRNKRIKLGLRLGPLPKQRTWDGNQRS